MVTCAVDTGCRNHARISRREEARAGSDISYACDHNDVVVDRVADFGPRIGIVYIGVREAKNRSTMINCPTDSARERATPERLRRDDGKDLGPWRDAAYSAVRDDEAGHSGAVSFRVAVRVRVERRHGVSGEHASIQVGVSGIDTSVDHAHNDPLALAELLCLVDM